MRYRILGELDVVGARGVLQTSAPRQLVVLATLLLEANHAVPVDRLVDAVWDEAPPSTARGQIQICVSALRRALVNAGIPDAIHTRTPGYLIRAPDGELDLQVFTRLAAAGRAAAAGQRLAEAAELYGEALALWRGLPFADIDSRLIQAAGVTLIERRLALVEESAEVRLQLGQHHELIGELMELTAENPVRERLRAQLMTALYRDGRQAEALEVYRQARQAFIEELGLEPGRALQRVERDILSGELELDPTTPAAGAAAERASEPAAAPRLLPADIADFTGHDAVVDELRGVLVSNDGGADASPAAIAALSGKGGVGKTTLAVHVAHQLVDEFPDGQLYVTLRGNEARPVSPMQVLERFLRALGLPGPAIPQGLDERAEMYRDRLAGRRVLIVLDDAADEDQVAPLLPGTGTSAIVVTSRLRLTRLAGAHRVDLAVFDPAPAMELLTKVAGAGRVNAEPAEARSLVLCCGGLPLALRIAAARLAARPHWTFARLVARLEDEHHRLDELAHGGQGIRSNIAVSYEALNDQAKRLFRRLGMLEAADFDAWVSVALLDVPAGAAEDALEALVDVQLLDVDRIGLQGARYRFHDLIRVYARERLAAEEPPAERRAALCRVLGAWLYLAREAHRREYGGDFTVLHGTAELWPLPDVVDELLAEPLEWYERERLALVAAVRQAADGGLDELCWDLAMSSVTLFEVRSYREDWRETHHAALAATRRAGNRRGEAAMLYSLGSLNLLEQRFDEAQQRLAQAAEMFTALGDTHGRSLAERNLAYMDRVQGDVDGALARYGKALDDLRLVGDSIAEAHVLSNIAQVQIELERYSEAEGLLAVALGIARKVGANRVVAQTLYRLGEAYVSQGDYAQGGDAFQSVLGMVDAAGDIIGGAYARYGLGLVQTQLGEFGKAEATLRRAQRMAVEAGEQLLVAQVFLALGEVYRAAGRQPEAVDRVTAARDLFARIGAAPWLSRAEQLLSEVKGPTTA